MTNKELAKHLCKVCDTMEQMMKVMVKYDVSISTSDQSKVFYSLYQIKKDLQNGK